MMERSMESPGARSSVLVALALAALGLAAVTGGCGRGETTRPKDGRLEVRLGEYRIEPGRVQARPGRLTLVSRDDGILAHRLAVGRGRLALAVAPPVKPGQTASVTVDLPKGRFQLFCALSNHDVLGMRAPLEVR
jgi:hypothetical protein